MDGKEPGPARVIPDKAIHVSDQTTDPQTDPNAALAALADGTLAPAQARELTERVQRSPELRALLAEQQRTLALLQGTEVTAPPALRARVQSLTEGASGARKVGRGPRQPLLAWRPARPRRALGMAMAAAALAGLVVGLLTGGAASPRWRSGPPPSPRRPRTRRAPTC
jgi:anti-sigma-K factor RskA